MNRIKNIVGQTFRNWTVIKIDGGRRDKCGRICWVCQCNLCSGVTSLSSDSLIFRKTNNCECQKPYLKNFAGLQIREFTVIKLFCKKIRALYWECLCKCGKIKIIPGYQLANPNGIKSCGCQKLENLIIKNTKHGYTRTKTYNTWQHMRRRCSDPKAGHFNHYGGRGIKVCDRWDGEHGFENFLEDMGEKPENMSIDRIDVNGNYCPENCRWATDKEQSRNKTSSVLVTFNGKTQCAAAWAEELGMDDSLLRRRIRQGWTPEEMFWNPKVKSGYKRQRFNIR